MDNDKQVLVKNVVYLYILRVASCILPLITLPYLVRLLGPERFGILALATGLIQCLVYVTDYGFNVTTTRKISVFRNDKDRVETVFNSVLLIKSFLLIVSFIILSAIVTLVPRLREYWFIYLFTFGQVIGSVLFPLWFFQGMERLQYVTILNVIGRVIFTLAIFTFIRSKNDFPYVPVIDSLCYIGVGIMSLRIAVTEFGIKLRLPRISDIIEELKEGWHIFSTLIVHVVFLSGAPLFIGLITNYKVVGYYSAGDRVVNAFEQMFTPLWQALYPYVGKMVSRSRDSAIRLLRKIVEVVGALTFVLSIIVILFAGNIGSLILGNQFAESTHVIRILAILIFIRQIRHIFLAQTMVNFGDDKNVFKLTLFAVSVGFVALVILTKLFFETGAASAIVISELVLLFTSLQFIKKRYDFFAKKIR